MIVFQDLTLRAGAGASPGIRAALLDTAVSPWRHEPEMEREAKGMASADEDILVFARDADRDVKAASLFLWSNAGGYEVTNIVPRNGDGLGERGYNAVLSDFVERVVRPASARAGFRIEATAAEQTLEDWLPDAAASALRRFSATANRATGSSHPSDQARWHTFLIAAHGAAPALGTDLLRRWLIEDGWTEDRARELAVEYEFGLALLDARERLGD